MQKNTRSSSSYFQERESLALDATFQQPRSYSVNQVRSVFLGLIRDEALWQADLNIALMRVMDAGLMVLGCEVASIWCFGDNPEELFCFSQVEAGIGPVSCDYLMRSEAQPFLTALRQDRLVAVADALHDPRTQCLADNYLQTYRVRSLIAAASRTDGQVSGMLCFEHLQAGRQWSEAEKELVLGLAGLIAQLLMADELRRQRELLSVLHQLTPELSLYATPEELAQYTVDKLDAYFEGAWLGIYNWDGISEEINLLACTEHKMPDYFSASMKTIPLVGTLKTAISTRDIVSFNNFTQKADASIGINTIGLAAGVQALVTVPILVREDIMGFMLLIYQDMDQYVRDSVASLRAMMSTFAVNLAGVLQLRSIRRSALQDKDTGLGNTEQLTIDIRRMEPEGDHFFLLIDIQGYREINRAYSRKSGDRILMALSDRIASHAALHGANAYRLNGVEFGVLLTSKPGNLKSIMTNLRILLENPVLIEDQRSVLTSSIGATRVEAGEKPGAVLERADKALNRAERTFERCAVYDDAMAADIDSGEALAQQLKEAIAQGSRGGLELSYQGKLDLRTGKLVGCEALLSWPGRPGGALSGEETAVVAEQHGLMKLLTGWVARQAISQASIFKALGFEIPIAINLSAYSVLDEELGVHLQELLEEFAVEPADLELEISEVQLLSDPLRIGPVVRDLVDRGFRLDVDDFGLGAAAVRYLDQLPINVVKISQNIIAQCRDSLISREVLASSLRVIRQLGLKSLAVGVEEPEVVELLQTLNCDMAQGGAFSHAMNPGQFIEWVTRLK